MPLPNPIGLQREVLDLPARGHFVVLGTAGSGKTTLAILRSAYLANAHCEKGEFTLLVTFNRALVTYLKTITDGELENVEVRNYHRFARGYLSSRGLLGRNDIISPEQKERLIEKAIVSCQEDVGKVATLKRSVAVFVEEIQWIERMGIGTLEDYDAIERIGRSGTRILRSNRKYFFMVYEKYLKLRGEAGFKYDWDDMAFFVNKELQRDEGPRRYKHVVIDEGQDFSPMMLKSLAKAIPEDGSLTYFGDVAQQIYGGRISWRNAGLNPPAVWNFVQNYRNTQQIAALGVAISNSPYFKDEADLVTPVSPKASGPLPALVSFNNESDEVKFVLDQAINLGKSQTIGILLRDRETVAFFKRKLNLKGVGVQIIHRDMVSLNFEPGISIGTYHSAKGLEFDAIILPFCNVVRLPDSKRVEALDSEEEAMTEEIKLLYVAITRARNRLLITYTGDKTKLLPDAIGLYQEFKR